MADENTSNETPSKSSPGEARGDTAGNTSSTGAGRGVPYTPDKAQGTDPAKPRGDIHTNPDENGNQKLAFSTTEADGKGDGTAQDSLGAPGDGGDSRTETPEERKAQHPDAAPSQHEYKP